jgi:hypothetical protein
LETEIPTTAKSLDDTFCFRLSLTPPDPLLPDDIFMGDGCNPFPNLPLIYPVTFAERNNSNGLSGDASKPKFR